MTVDCDVFISYRIVPDASYAKALKTLLEATIDSAPSVFVSSAGGLRPSETTFFQQLQQNAQSAKFFVGIITTESQDQPWISFEAGAAWGRGVPYTPLLIGLSAGALSSTISPYQAARAFDKGSMHGLIAAIANSCDKDVRPRFGTSFGAFERKLAAVRDGRDDATDVSAPTSIDERAIEYASEVAQLLDRGEQEEATKKKNEFLASTPSAKATSEFETNAITQQDSLSKDDKLRELSNLPDDIKLSTAGLLATASIASDVSPLESIEIWKKLSDTSKRPSLKRICLTEIVRTLVRIGHRDEAVRFISKNLEEPDTATRREAAACFCETQESEGNDSARAPLAIFSNTEDDRHDRWRTAMDILSTHKAHPLLAYLTKRWNNIAQDESSSYQRGRSLATIGLPSLAWRELNRSIEKGSEIAIALQSKIIASNPVPAAGLDPMSKHEGDYNDAAYKSFPHNARAEMEEKLDEEEHKLRELEKNGRTMFFAVREMVAKWLDHHAGQAETPAPREILPCKGWTLTFYGSSASLKEGSTELELKRSDVFPGIYVNEPAPKEKQLAILARIGQEEYEFISQGSDKPIRVVFTRRAPSSELPPAVGSSDGEDAA